MPKENGTIRLSPLVETNNEGTHRVKEIHQKEE